MFRSFIPRRNSAPRPDPDPTDPDSTQVHSDLSSLLHRHILAQQTDPTAVGPTNTVPRDGIRHGQPPNPLAPQRTPQNDETRIFPTILRPPANYRYPSNPTQPTQSTQRTQYSDPTDVGAQLHRHESTTPPQLRRTLEYYGNPQIKNILVVVGMQVHGSSIYGVEITANGPTLQREIIPWHRVHALIAAPGDPILRPTN